MTNKSDLPLLIFDLDGTLIDSATDIHVALNQMLKKYGRPQVALPVLVSHIGDGLTKLVNDFFPEYELGSPDNLKKVDEFLDLYSDEFLTKHTTLYDGVKEFLFQYQGPMALVTNKSIKPTIQILEHFNLNKVNWIDIIGGDSLAEKKPSPLALNRVMKKINHSPANTWMIGDGRPDMKAAEAAGCKKAAVHYGYSEPEILAPYKPDFILNNFIEIHQLIG